MADDLDLDLNEAYITTRKASARIGVTPTRVNQLVQSGLLVSAKKGMRYYVTVESVDAWIALRTRRGPKLLPACEHCGQVLPPHRRTETRRLRKELAVALSFSDKAP